MYCVVVCSCVGYVRVRFVRVVSYRFLVASMSSIPLGRMYVDRMLPASSRVVRVTASRVALIVSGLSSLRIVTVVGMMVSATVCSAVGVGTLTLRLSDSTLTGSPLMYTCSGVMVMCVSGVWGRGCSWGAGRRAGGGVC